MNDKTWKAYRFELVFFNSGENRWQLFQESPFPNKCNGGKHEKYRQQIYSILEILRQVFTKKFEYDTDSDIHISCQEALDERITITKEQIKDFIRGVPITIREKIIKDIRSSFKGENLNVSGGLLSLLDILHIGTDIPRRLKIPRQDALNLLSCLQIRRSWDIYGILDKFYDNQEYKDLIQELLQKPFFLYQIYEPPNSKVDSASEQKNDAFICYDGEDVDIVSQINDQLKDHHLKTYMDKKDFNGDAITSELDPVLKSSRAAIIFIGTSNIKKNGYQNSEVETCHSWRKKSGIKIIPVLLPSAPKSDDYNMPNFLDGFHHIDMRCGNTDDKINELVNHLLAGTQYTSNCENILGYPVKLKIAKCQNLQDKYSVDCPTFDFYKICNDIKEINSIEAKWYALYGKLVDAIQYDLAPTSSQSFKQIYVAIYNIKACGWNHYFQIYFHQEVYDLNKGLAELATALESMKGICSSAIGSEGMFTLTNHLRELLVQTRISVFQVYVSELLLKDDTWETYKCKDDLPNIVGSLFCKYAHNLAQVDWMCCGDDYYGYPHPNEVQTPEWDKLKESDFKDDGNDQCVMICSSPIIIKARISLDKFDSQLEQGALKPMLLGAATQRLVDQYNWLQQQAERQSTIRILKNNIEILK